MSDTLVPNIITSISGYPKSGKTHLSMSWPEPIKIYSFDLGADFIRAKFPDKHIDIHNFDLPIIDSDPPDPYAEAIWDEFKSEYKKDVEGGTYKTVILDTATAVWEIVRHAITEEKNRKKLLEVEYALPNIKMYGLFARPRVTGVNLITIQYLRDKYVKGENSGIVEMDGWKRTEGQADLVLWITRATVADKSVMRTTIKDNRFDRDLNGKTFDDTNFSELLAILGL